MMRKKHIKVPFYRQKGSPNCLHWRNFVFFLVLVSIICLALKYHRLKYLVASAALHQLSLLEASQNVEPTLASQFICKDLRINTFITIINAVDALLYLYRSCHKLTLYKGYKYAKHCILYLFINNKHYSVPIKLRTVSSNLHLFSVESEFLPTQISPTINLLWDVLQINWQMLKLTIKGNL